MMGSDGIVFPSVWATNILKFNVMKSVVYVLQAILYIIMVVGGVYLSIDSFMNFGQSSSAMDLCKGIFLALFSLFVCCRMFFVLRNCRDGNCDSHDSCQR